MAQKRSSEVKRLSEWDQRIVRKVRRYADEMLLNDHPNIEVIKDLWNDVKILLEEEKQQLLKQAGVEDG